MVNARWSDGRVDGDVTLVLLVVVVVVVESKVIARRVPLKVGIRGLSAGFAGRAAALN